MSSKIFISLNCIQNIPLYYTILFTFIQIINCLLPVFQTAFNEFICNGAKKNNHKYRNLVFVVDHYILFNFFHLSKSLIPALGCGSFSCCLSLKIFKLGALAKESYDEGKDNSAYYQ